MLTDFPVSNALCRHGRRIVTVFHNRKHFSCDFVAWIMHLQIMMKISPTKCILKVNHVFIISYQSCSYMFRRCRSVIFRELATTHLMLLISFYHSFYQFFYQYFSRSCTHFCIFSQCIFYFNFSTYDVAYAQFRQGPSGSLKMAFLQRRNM
jgi:hypothetical protein